MRETLSKNPNSYKAELEEKMSRAKVRDLKRLARNKAVNEDVASESAVALLCRSVRFGHGRLAVLRFIEAVESRGQIPLEALDYCTEVAAISLDPHLRSRFHEAARQLAGGPSDASLPDRSFSPPAHRTA